MAKSYRAVDTARITRVEYKAPDTIHGRSRISLDRSVARLAESLIGKGWEEAVSDLAERLAARDPRGSSISRAVAAAIIDAARQELERLRQAAHRSPCPPRWPDER
jgi:hypothetical protein